MKDRGTRNYRFIPTHVGNTRYLGRPITPPTVHPHTRGEHKHTPRCVIGSSGSSPHTWGTREPCDSLRRRARFIPTHVGNTIIQEKIGENAPVHPHTRGEHVVPLRPVRFVAGSSPHTWGTPSRGILQQAKARFIPTHVGNTCDRRCRTEEGAVHPHTRGDPHACGCETTADRGSSPHTWGTPGPGSGRPSLPRFIPTHVGNTCAPT